MQNQVPESVDVLVAQCGPQPWSPEGGGERLAEWLAPELARERADLVVLSELATTPFFSVSLERSWLNAGERLESPGIRALGRLAREAAAHVVVPFAERGPHGELYNSAAVLGPDGEPVVGRVVSGPRRGEPETTYRKVHLSENNNTDPGVHEKYFFRPGDGFVVHDLPFGTLAILICYDRSFPEAWRTVRLAGARFVVVPVGSSRPERAAMFARELQIGAVHNGVFALGASKGGSEPIEDGARSVTYFGSSQVVTPFGETLAEGPLAEGPAFVRARLQLKLLDDYERSYHLMRDRRPDAY
ncbi:MAG TPA: carbon-nitrogen hydrolase family protein [Conexibacter sp.]|nr:carbon-nitrogen hydrolase family protein [Conexibacter sp.]